MPKGAPKGRVTVTERLQQALFELLAEHEGDGALPTNWRNELV